MPVVAVINRKGGSGKSTLATHLAAYCATQGWPVLLGDTDRNQSSMAWLRMREHNLPNPRATITGRWVDPRAQVRPPPGTQHVVLDTPGGLHGFELARLVCHADAVLLPVCNSLFDRESAAECWAELKVQPRVTSGRCKVAALGMRLDVRSRSTNVLAHWAQGLGLPYLGSLRETQGYVRCVENGLTLFDLPPASVTADMAQWAPVLKWLQPVLKPERSVQEQMQKRIHKPYKGPSTAAIDAAGLDAGVQPIAAPGAGKPSPAPAHGKAPPALVAAGAGDWGHRLGKMLGGLQLRRFLLQKP